MSRALAALGPLVLALPLAISVTALVGKPRAGFPMA